MCWKRKGIMFTSEQLTEGEIYTRNDLEHLQDRLEWDTLYWDGQPSGRTDKLIIDHEANGYELLVFYRKYKTEHRKSGFRYEGRFRYVSHRDGQPSHFVLRRVGKD